MDYAAALRQYQKYGRGRSMKKFCEDEGYDYWKFCKLAREGQIEMASKSGTDKRPGFKEQNLKSCERCIARLKPGSVADLMKSIEDRLADYALSDDAGCGELLKKALRYARAEWPAMKRVLESGEVEISNNISEQSVRKLKMNLRNAGNIGSESSAADNAFMYSVIESCRHNEIDPGKYVSYLLGKLKAAREGEDLTGLLPCYCGL